MGQMKKPIQIPATLESVSTRKDHTLKVVFGTQEMSSESKTALFDMSQNLGWLAFVPNSVEYDNEVEIPNYNAPRKEGSKSLSQKYRDCLYRLWEKKQSSQTFDDFYYNRYTMLINEALEELDPFKV